LNERGVAVLGPLPTALPHVRLTLVDGRDALQLVPVALIVALVCMVQTAVVLREFPSQPDATGDPSRDFAAVGIGSIASAFFGAFAVDASPPRTAIAASSGGRSQLTGIAAVLAVGLLAVFGAHLASYLPLAALAGVLVFIATRIFRLGDMLRIARLGGWEIWLVVAGALLVIVFPIEIGMVLAIGLSLLHGIYIVARPPSTELVRIPGTTIWWPPGSQAGERVRGVLVFSPAAPITFTNGQYIVSRLRGLIAAAPQPVRLVVLEGGGVIDVDYTGAVLVRAVIADLRKRGIRVALARFESERARSGAAKTGLLAALGADSVFDSVHEALSALDDLSARARTQPQRP
jgi:MFS superfamily sulfate permease-like transporter